MRYKSSLGFLSIQDFRVIIHIMTAVMFILWIVVWIDVSIANNQEYQENIYSLSNPTRESNNFVLGLGSEGFDTYYYFYTEENGSYILNQVKVDGSEIHFVNTNSSYAIITTSNRGITGKEMIKKRTAELYFPKDTILQTAENIVE